MSDNTKIEWTEATWNIITGCSVVSAGCKHCYAMKLAGTRLQHHSSRSGLTIETANGPVWNGETRFNAKWLDQPLKWKRPRKIFVCAHGDLFHESVPDEWIAQVFGIMALAKQHTFQILTKRPERMQSWISRATAAVNNFDQTDLVSNFQKLCGCLAYPEAQRNFPLPNVWLGVSVENQAAADERIPLLLQTPAAVRWISAEPLLGPVDLRKEYRTQKLGKYPFPDLPSQHRTKLIDLLDWVVVGGESGHNARPMHQDWVRLLRDQCAAASVPFMFKQWGEWGPSLLGQYETHKEYEPQRALTIDITRFGNDSITGLGVMAFASKRRTGRLLDGVEHNGYPSA